MLNAEPRWPFLSLVRQPRPRANLFRLRRTAVDAMSTHLTVVESSRAIVQGSLARSRRSRAPSSPRRGVTRCALSAKKSLAPPSSKNGSARVSDRGSPAGSPAPAWGHDSTTYVFLGAVCVTSLAAATATAVTVAVPLMRSLTRLSDSVDAAARAAEKAAIEMEDLAKITKVELPTALDAMEDSAEEVEILATEMREALARLDASEWAENFLSEWTSKIKDPAKDFANLGDDASEYVRRLSLELGLVMQSVGAYLDDGTFDEATRNLTADEKAQRRESITSAIDSAKALTTQVNTITRGGAKGRDLADIVSKFALASQEVSTAMARVFDPIDVSKRSRDE
jgi:hypothetical protein